jgi:hypothetical protein
MWLSALFQGSVQPIQGGFPHVFENGLSGDPALTQYQINVRNARATKVDRTISLLVFDISGRHLVPLHTLDDNRKVPFGTRHTAARRNGNGVFVCPHDAKVVPSRAANGICSKTLSGSGIFSPQHLCGLMNRL